MAKTRGTHNLYRRDEVWYFDGYVNGGRVRYEPRTAFATAKKKAKVTWASSHTLRHTFASHLVSNGVSLYKVSRWLGHKDLTTTQIYAHLAPQDDDINRL